jgi:hypothetical protein
MLIDSLTATEAAKRGLKSVRLEQNPGAAAALAAGRPGIPLFVRRLDIPERDYYLVPWLDERGIVMVVQVDAQSGEMSSFAALPSPTPRLAVGPEEARRTVEQQLNEKVISDLGLAWQPSRESASSLQPLYQLQVGSGDAFVANDGAVYRSLTSFGKGG